LIHAGIGCLVIGFELPVLDQRAFPPGFESVPMGLVVIALVRRQRLKLLQVPLRKLRPDLRVMLAGGRHVEIQHGLRSSIHQQRRLERPNLELDPLGVVAAGIAAIPAGGIHRGNPISQEQGSTDPLQHAPDRSAQTLEGLLHGGEVRQLLEAQGLPEAGHLPQPIP